MSNTMTKPDVRVSEVEVRQYMSDFGVDYNLANSRVYWKKAGEAGVLWFKSNLLDIFHGRREN